MNVLYDISIMGSAHGSSTAKTGIPRVVESLAFELAEMPGCHLELCSSGFLPGSLDYVNTHPRLKTLSFPHSKFGASVQRQQSSAQHAIDKSSGASCIIARAERKLMHYVTKYAQSSLETLDPNSLQNADIYHSTYLALPEQVKALTGTHLFLTLYDLIPLLYPQYSSGYIDSIFEAILSSINEDTWLLSISEATKVDLCSHLKIDPARVFVTPLAADHELFYPVTDAAALGRVRDKYGIQNAPYVLSLCTIEPRKNIDHVIRCFVKLMREKKTPDLQLVLAGSKGWNYDHIFREIDGAEAFKDNIVVTGFVANEDLAALYSGALVFVFPSLYEGFGLPPLEAMQCGVPVITSNTSSLPEVVGEAGIMLDPHDVDGLCQSVLDIYQSTEMRAVMGRKSLERAKQFSWKRCAELTVQAYQTALRQ